MKVFLSSFFVTWYFTRSLCKILRTSSQSWATDRWTPKLVVYTIIFPSSIWSLCVANFGLSLNKHDRKSEESSLNQRIYLQSKILSINQRAYSFTCIHSISCLVKFFHCFSLFITRATADPEKFKFLSYLYPLNNRALCLLEFFEPFDQKVTELFWPFKTQRNLQNQWVNQLMFRISSSQNTVFATCNSKCWIWMKNVNSVEEHDRFWWTPHKLASDLLYRFPHVSPIIVGTITGFYLWFITTTFSKVENNRS